jgi:hypothetical protein
VRLDQCRRYLRLALHERAAGPRFLYDYDVAPQEILPLLTRTGAEFEREVEAAAATRFPTRLMNLERAEAGRDRDNDELAAAARGLAAGSVLVLFQPRLRVSLDGWAMTGDADIVRLERDETGDVRILVADMKATTTAKVEHRLQVAFYREMIERLLAETGVTHRGVAIGILYRGTAQPEVDDPQTLLRRERERAEARRLFGVENAFLELTPDPEAYRDAVRGLVTGSNSVANSVAAAPFAAIPWHLSYKCDGCLYNEFCMKWAAERDDLSLLPHLTEQDKSALQDAGIATTRALATLLEPVPDAATGAPDPRTLAPAAGTAEVARRAARAWPVGPRLEELVHRARRHRARQGDDVAFLPYIPSKGYGSLPYSDATQNPNLVRVFIDAQHDYLQDRIYLIGALITGNEGGAPAPARRGAVVAMTGQAPDEAGERALLVDWIERTIRAIAEVAAPDEDGELKAPIHLIFFNSFEQRLLLGALGRHAREILAATPVYDFLTQLAAFDSPVATFLDREIRELKNYPFVCQSLQAVAASARPDGEWFDWNSPQPYREIFRERLFDALGRFEANESGEAGPWATRRARFNSQIPLEYAYAAWGALETTSAGEKDPYAPYRQATVPLLRGFQQRRLEAMEHVARDFRGNKDTTKTPFAIPDLATFDGKAQGLTEALQEFVTIERHVALAAWKAARLAPPERRVLAGETLIVSYRDADQLPGVAAINAENGRRAKLREERQARLLAAHPDDPPPPPTKAEKALLAPLPLPAPFRVRIEVADCQVSLDDALALSTLKAGERVVVAPRWMQDGRLPEAERVDLTPTPKALLYRMRCDLEEIAVERDGEGRATAAWLVLRPAPPMQSNDPPGFLFMSHAEPLAAGKLYTIDPDPNDIYGFWTAKVVQGLLAGEENTLFARIRDRGGRISWPAPARTGQARFMAGLQTLHQAGAGPAFEASKTAYIGEHGEAPLLLVQGPPGTGKSFTTAYAILARMQGAMAAGLPCRVVAGAKTHAATDVLLASIAAARARLTGIAASHPELFDRFFDRRLLTVPLYRLQPRGETPAGVAPLYAGAKRPKPEQPKVVPLLRDTDYAVVAATPGAVYSAAKDESGLFGHDVADLLVLDEASQLSLPESLMAALLLKPDGQIVVVGDHRQMAPIVQHDWDNETRRTFQDYAVYRSLFETVQRTDPPLIQFAESFRLDRDMAEFLRRGVYASDDLDFHSNQIGRLREIADPDPFVAAALSPEHPLVVIVHDERSSQLRNDFERALTAPLLTALHGAGYRVRDGFGLVVPHRAQRANLQEALRAALPGAEDADEVARAVDTVERFQGGERDAIIVSATESDPAYLLAAGQFLYDPRRLTVAVSRARDKMILVASRSVFELFSPDEEIFANAQLWKDLLGRTCTVPLWDGEIAGHGVEVWGNPPLTAAMTSC